MAGVPDGWERVDRYAIRKGIYTICRVTVGGELWFELHASGKPVFLHREKANNGGLEQCLELADELKEAA